MTGNIDLIEAPKGLGLRGPIDQPGAEPAPLPQVIYVELADYCNLNCTFCGREAEILKTGNKGGFVDIEQVKKLEQPLRAAKYFGLSGRIGEPLIYPKLSELLEWLYVINPGILLRITTNGTALTRKMADLLAGHIDFVGISLNAANASAYARDMRPVGYRPGMDWTPNWTKLIQRISQFLDALPCGDRKRVFVIIPAHRDNIDDLPDFVRLAANMGCSRAVITPMQVHDEKKIDMSIYWMKDKYNDVIDHAMTLGTELGIRVDAARFYQTVKSDIDVGTLCRDPLEVAYLNMEKQGETAPCCHWAEKKIQMDVYRDRDGFERFWNQEVLQRLRAKRDFKSCKACGLTRAFDELTFHFTPFLKGKLIELGRITDGEANNAYPDHQLVRACSKAGLDLASLRRTLTRIGSPLERLNAIIDTGILALPELDRDCWGAFLATNPPVGPTDLALAGCFSGIGWGLAEHDAARKLSGRWLIGNGTASIFLRVEPSAAHELRLTACHIQPSCTIRLTVCEQALTSTVSIGELGEATITAEIPAKATRAHRGYLWLTVSTTDAAGAAVAALLSRLQISRLSKAEVGLRRVREAFVYASTAGSSAADFVRNSVRRRLGNANRRLATVLYVARSDPIGFIPRAGRRLVRPVLKEVARFRKV
jgi:MoaA/NifB/PqqE/SkfB family radical SAM enzyme